MHTNEICRSDVRGSVSGAAVKSHTRLGETDLSSYDAPSFQVCDIIPERWLLRN